MRPVEYITERQHSWALRHGIPLDENGWAVQLNDNLFLPLIPEAIREFEAGAGQELEGPMRAPHSSSALAVNVFSKGLHERFEGAGIDGVGPEPLGGRHQAPGGTVTLGEIPPDEAFLLLAQEEAVRDRFIDVGRLLAGEEWFDQSLHGLVSAEPEDPTEEDGPGAPGDLEDGKGFGEEFAGRIEEFAERIIPDIAEGVFQEWDHQDRRKGL